METIIPQQVSAEDFMIEISAQYMDTMLQFHRLMTYPDSYYKFDMEYKQSLITGCKQRMECLAKESNRVLNWAL